MGDLARDTGSLHPRIQHIYRHGAPPSQVPGCSSPPTGQRTIVHLHASTLPGWTHPVCPYQLPPCEGACTYGINGPRVRALPPRLASYNFTLFLFLFSFFGEFFGLVDCSSTVCSLPLVQNAVHMGIMPMCATVTRDCLIVIKLVWC